MALAVRSHPRSLNTHMPIARGSLTPCELWVLRLALWVEAVRWIGTVDWQPAGWRWIVGMGLMAGWAPDRAREGIYVEAP